MAGDFNNWSGEEHVMHRVNDNGIWTLFIPGIGEKERYKYEIVTNNGEIRLKADPYAIYSEVRPNTASLTYDLEGYSWQIKNGKRNRRLRRCMKKLFSFMNCILGLGRSILMAGIIPIKN